jgi:hypothetical protein
MTVSASRNAVAIDARSHPRFGRICINGRYDTSWYDTIWILRVRERCILSGPQWQQTDKSSNVITLHETAPSARVATRRLADFDSLGVGALRSLLLNGKIVLNTSQTCKVENQRKYLRIQNLFEGFEYRSGIERSISGYRNEQMGEDKTSRMSA